VKDGRMGTFEEFIDDYQESANHCASVLNNAEYKYLETSEADRGDRIHMYFDELNEVTDKNGKTELLQVHVMHSPNQKKSPKDSAAQKGKHSKDGKIKKVDLSPDNLKKRREKLKE